MGDIKMIKVLDCTLRDGGYINDWNFKINNINMICDKLYSSKVDYIELGYIDENCKEDLNNTKFNSFDAIKRLNLKSKNNLCMIDYGKFAIDNVPKKNDTNLFGIRVAFSKKNMIDAIEYCRSLKEKGYNVFVQPMVTSSYTKKELEILLAEVNKLNPYAIYIVDSFGSMNEKDVVALLKKYDKTLNSNIKIGFHSHNNLQLAYSNSLTFIKNHKEREVIIDSSVYGIGRGAGNLATELIVSYLNNNYAKNYKTEFLLEIVDNYLLDLKKEKNWGYCLEYYLSAIHNCHPNYSKFLAEMHTTTIYDMENILNKISDDKKLRFDKEYLIELYTSYMNKKINDNNSYEKLSKILFNKKVLLLGSGTSLKKEQAKLEKKIINNDTVIISVNNINQLFECDFTFISNKRRFSQLKLQKLKNIICTSNIEDYPKESIVFDYINNLATEYENSDNSLLILLNILIKADIKEVSLAGFDGFSVSNEQNYYDDNLSYVIEKEQIDKLNNLMKKYLNLYNKKIKINWLTTSNYTRRSKK